MQYGKNFKQARIRAGLSVRRAASAAGVAPAVIQNAEAGCDVRLSSALKMAAAYGVTVAQLLTPEVAS